MKKIAGDIIVLHMCTKNHNHNDVWLLRYGVRQNFLSLWTIFCPFTPLWTQKIKNFEKLKKTPWRYHHFTKVYQKS